MTIGVQVTTGPHKARVTVTGHEPRVIGPDETGHFAAHSTGSVLIEEVDEGEGTVHADDTGDAGPPPHNGNG